MKKCLIRDPKHRIQIMGQDGLLNHSFLTQQHQHVQPAPASVFAADKAVLVRNIAAQTLKYTQVRRGDEENIINTVVDRFMCKDGDAQQQSPPKSQHSPPCTNVHAAAPAPALRESAVSSHALLGASSKLKRRDPPVEKKPSIDLKSAIQSQGQNLKSLKSSDSNKWMKERENESPGKDLRSVLERGLNNMNFGDDTMQSNVGEDATWTFGQ
jgi:hypothetical protein